MAPCIGEQRTLVRSVRGASQKLIGRSYCKGDCLMKLEGFVLKKRSGANYSSHEIACEQYKLPYQETTPINTYSTTRVDAIDWNSFTGWGVPDYYRLRREGKLLPHTPWRKFTSKGSSTGEYAWEDQDRTEWYYDGNFPSMDKWQVTEEEVHAYAPSSYDEYVTTAAARIYSNGFDALTSMAEIKDVKKLYANVAESLAFVGESKVFMRLIKSLSWKTLMSHWMSMRYGWRPLIYEIIGLNEAIKNLNEKRTRWAERAGTKFTQSHYSSGVKSWSAFDVDWMVTDVVTTQIRGSVVADIDVPAFQINPLITAWEVVPLSFVVDWLVNVGQALSAVSFLAKVKKYSASYGIKLTVDRFFSAEMGQMQSQYRSGIGFEQDGRCLSELEIRTPCRIPVHPQILVRMNNFKVIDALALISQRIKFRR